MIREGGERNEVKRDMGEEREERKEEFGEKRRIRRELQMKGIKDEV